MVHSLRVERTGDLLASRATMARTLWTRMAGLLGRRGLPDGEALVFERCRAIHTVGMRFPIDVAFVDRTWRVVAVRSRVGPGRSGRPRAGPVPCRERTGG